MQSFHHTTQRTLKEFIYFFKAQREHLPPGYQNKVAADWQLVLIVPESFSQQPLTAITLHSATNSPGSDNA